MYNFKNKNLFSDDILKTNKNNNYYYDFGTGKQVERNDVKQERDAILNVENKTSTISQNQKKDDFLEGFNDPYGEKREQERKERFANIRANADKRNWSSQNDPFLEGFNQDSTEENGWIRAVDTIGRVSRAYEDTREKISPFIPQYSHLTPLARFAADLAIDGLKKAHYSRNEKNVPAPQTIDEAENMGWQIEDQDYCHQFTAPDRKNIKYVSSDGGEQIFDSKGRVVTADEDEATYNFFHPETEPFMHLLADVAPWVLWGNSPEDSTTKLERIVTPLVLKHYQENILPRSGDNSAVSGR